jgi:hypothetical protein
LGNLARYNDLLAKGCATPQLVGERPLLMEIAGITEILPRMMEKVSLV